MAVSEMKRLLLAADRPSKERILLSLQRMGCVELSAFDVEEAKGETALQAQRLGKAELDIGRLRWAISKLGKYSGEKTGMFSPKPAADMADMLPGDEEVGAAEALLVEVERLEREQGELRGRETRLRTALEQLSPWLKLDIPRESIADGKYYKQVLGSVKTAALPALMAAMSAEPCYIEQLSQTREAVNLWLAAHHSCAPQLTDALREAGFVPAALGDFDGDTASRAQSLEQELSSLAQEEERLTARMAVLTKGLPKLRVYHDALLCQRDRFVAGAQLLQTRDAFLLRGWVPARIEQRVTQALKAEFPGALIELSEPEAGDEPPVLLRNPGVIAPFESVVSGFSLPNFHSIDPTKVMMPFFACFFGMMVSDAGYGLMMALLVPLLIRVMKPGKGAEKLFWVIGIGGLFTLFWGVMYNTWFGFALLKNPPLDPIYRPMEVMVLCLAVGALHLLAGMAMGATLHIRRKEYLDVLYDQLSWLMLLSGLGMLAVPSLAGIGQWLALAGALIILLFAGRNKSKNPFKRVLSGLGALYNITGWISDLLSYMRLFGMGLATGVIGMVINILVGMVFSMGPIGWVIGSVIFVGGHIFNAGINILGAYVHACRLQYIEFFGKFFEEGGVPFRPLDFQPRFVRISDV